MNVTCYLDYGISKTAWVPSEHLHRYLVTGISCKLAASRSILRRSVRVSKQKVGDGGNGGNKFGGRGLGGNGGGHGPGDGAFGKSEGHIVAASIWARYMDLLESHPLVIKSITAGALNAFADFICQVLVEKGKCVDMQRLLSFTSIGMFLTGPGLHYWYGLLPKLIPVSGKTGLALRIAADQLVFTPLGIASFFVVLCTLEGRQLYIEEKLRKDWLPTVVANWKVWIPFQILNFGLIPPQLQVAATSLLGVAWSVFISFTGHS